MEPTEVLAHLKQIPMFRNLGEEGEEELLRLIPYVRERVYQDGETLLNENRVPDRTIVVMDGSVRLTQQPESPTNAVEHLEDLGAGAVLGRVSLRVGDFRNVTVTATERTRVLYIYFRELVRTYQNSDYLREHLPSPLQPDRLVDTLSTIPLFSQLDDRAGRLELYRLVRITHDQYFEDGEWLFRQGEISDRLIRVLAGRIKLTIVDEDGLLREVGTLTAGDVAGETGLLVGDFHDVIATAEGHARIIYILRTEFAELLQDRPNLSRKLQVSGAVERRRRIRRFEWVRDDEWVMTIVHRHWTRLVRQIAAPVIFLLLLMPALVLLLMNGTSVAFVISGFLAPVVVGLVGLIGYQYINWRDDIFVLTTQRIVHIERVWPFSLQREETALDNIQDIYEVRPGILPNLLDYGNLIAQTAGETIEVDMDYVTHPGELREMIAEQIGRAKARDLLRMRGQIRDLLARRLQIEEPPEEGESPPMEDEEEGTPFLPFVILRSAREYLFPASWSKIDQGQTILWRRYWLPGMLRYAAPLFLFLINTLGGLFLLGRILLPQEALLNAQAVGGLSGLVLRVRESNFGQWVVIWLMIEAALLGVLLWLIEDWHNDYFQLTPSHLILVQRRPLLLRKSRRQARLDRMQNLSYEVPSVLAKIFDYGHVTFETAGVEGQFQLKWLRHPEDVQKAISNRQYQHRQRQREFEARQRQMELVSWFTAYDDLHREVDTSSSGSAAPAP